MGCGASTERGDPGQEGTRHNVHKSPASHLDTAAKATPVLQFNPRDHSQSSIGDGLTPRKPSVIAAPQIPQGKAGSTHAVAVTASSSKPARQPLDEDGVNQELEYDLGGGSHARSPTTHRPAKKVLIVAAEHEEAPKARWDIDDAHDDPDLLPDAEASTTFADRPTGSSVEWRRASTQDSRHWGGRNSSTEGQRRTTDSAPGDESISEPPPATDPDPWGALQNRYRIPSTTAAAAAPQQPSAQPQRPAAGQQAGTSAAGPSPRHAANSSRLRSGRVHDGPAEIVVEDEGDGHHCLVQQAVIISTAVEEDSSEGDDSDNDLQWGGAAARGRHPQGHRHGHRQPQARGGRGGSKASHQALQGAASMDSQDDGWKASRVDLGRSTSEVEVMLDLQDVEELEAALACPM